MAHIPDGVLSLPVLAAGWTVAVAGVGYGLRRITDEEIPRVALFASAFFVVSLFAVPIGPTSIHLLLGGLMGIVLGPAIFPAALIALLLQAALFGFGGLTALGFNTAALALPGWLAGIACSAAARAPAGLPIRASLAAALAVGLTGVIVAVGLALSASAFRPAAAVMFATYVPLAVIEAVVTGFAVAFLVRVRPAFLAARPVLTP